MSLSTNMFSKPGDMAIVIDPTWPGIEMPIYYIERTSQIWRHHRKAQYDEIELGMLLNILHDAVCHRGWSATDGKRFLIVAEQYYHLALIPQDWKKFVNMLIPEANVPWKQEGF